MQPIVMNLRLFQHRGDVKDYKYSHNCLKWLLECLINCNREYLRINPETPWMYETKIRYARERKTEDWSAVPCLLNTMRGDCEDLSSWRVAELRERYGEPARAFLKFKNRNGFWLYHIQVLRYHRNPQGVWVPHIVEDPSVMLGMNKAEAKPLPIAQQIYTTAA